MSTKLLEVHPKELKFIFELKKQSSCSVRLTNKTNYDVAFKVKTTSPKKYCVRPNVGIILPKSTCEFTVTMQGQKVAPPELLCKDKFLIQSTIAPVGTTEEDITTSMFAKDEGKHVDEIKLRVVLVSPPESPVLSPINGVLKQVSILEASPRKDSEFMKAQFDSLAKKSSREWNSGQINEPKFNKVKDMELDPVKDINGVEDDPELLNDLKYNKEKVMDQKPERDLSGVEVESGPFRKQLLSEVKDAGMKPNKDVHIWDWEGGLFNGQNFNNVKDMESKPLKIVDNWGSETPKGAEFTPVKDEVDDAEPQLRNAVASSTDKETINVKDLELEKDEKSKLDEDAICREQQKPKDEAVLRPVKDIGFMKVKASEELNLVSDIEEMKTKLNKLETKLNQAEFTISKLTEERKLSIEERKNLREELAVLRRSANIKRAPQGFPLLFVVMVAFVSTVLGYISHS